MPDQRRRPRNCCSHAAWRLLSKPFAWQTRPPQRRLRAVCRFVAP
jgi:hypothetical protein